MSGAVVRSLARARDDLGAASVLLSQGFPPQATSRAYYAAFHAAEAALIRLGETRGKHSAVISAFGRLVIKDGGFDPAVGRILSRLFAARGEADYAGTTTREEAESALADAERFVAAVEGWISSRD